MKVKLFDKDVIKKYLSFLGILEVCSAILMEPLNLYETLYSCDWFYVIYISILVLAYLACWRHSNRFQNINLRINNTDVEIKYGDMFNENGKKVITFNEYFDTIVDNKIINAGSINGIFIRKKIQDIPKFDRQLSTLLKDFSYDLNEQRKKGKKKKYPLGTMVMYDNEFLITAFTKFDENNNAEITKVEYIKLLMEIWKKIDVYYAQEEIVIPLLGNGTTRIKEFKKHEQELLKIILWTFKMSNITYAAPSKIKIILHESSRKNINLFKIKEEFNNE